MIASPRPTADACDVRTAACQRNACLLFAAVLLIHGGIFNGTGWNQNARYDAIFAFVEPGHPETGTFQIDRFVVDPVRGSNTGDWARHDGHLYSNKAPGSTWLGIPVYALAFHVERLCGLDPESQVVATANAWIINLWVSVFWTALATVVIYHRLAETSPERAALAAFAYGFGTLVFPFDTQLWGHPTAAAMLVLGWDALARGRPARGGMWLGLAVACDFIAVLGAAIVALGTFARQPRMSAALRLALGALPIAILLAIYHHVCFGGWFETGFRHSNPDLFRDSGGPKLLGAFDAAVLLRLLISPERGLFVFMPVLAFSAVGFVQGLRSADRARTLVAAAVALGHLVLNACFWGWHGGGSSGPRYLIVSLPFWCLLLPARASLSRWWRLAFDAALGISCLNMLLIAGVDVMALPATKNPLFTDLWPALLDGVVHRTAYAVRLFDETGTTIPPVAAFNVFRRWCGLPGPASLVPFAAAIIGLGTWTTRRRMCVSSAP